MAVFKDSGDTRSYTANTLDLKDLRIPNFINESVAVDGYNWPGKIASINVAAQGVAYYTATFYHATIAPFLKKSSSSGSYSATTNKSSYGYTADAVGDTNNSNHATVPGQHFHRGFMSKGSVGVVYFKLFHSTDDSQERQHAQGSN